MRNKFLRPSFVELALENTMSVVRDGGAWRLFPLWILTFGGLGELASRVVVRKALEDLSISVPIYVGLLTFDGLLLALSWGAFARIYESICSTDFSKYLRDNDMLTRYMFHVMYVHFAQVVAVIFSAVGLILTITEGIPLDWQRAALGLALGSGGYAVKEACGAVTIMNDLVWYRSIFDATENNSSNVKVFPSSK